MPSIKLDCPDCGHVFALSLERREDLPHSPINMNGYAWYRRGDDVNERVVESLQEFLATQPVAVRMTVAKLYQRYWDFMLEHGNVALSLRSFSVALRDLGHVPYRTGDARGFVLGGQEAAARAPGGSYSDNVDRAIEQAKQHAAAMMAESEQASPEEEWWK